MMPLEKRMPAFRALRFAALLVPFFAPAANTAIAAEIDEPEREAIPPGYAIRAGALYTDNIDRVSSDERDETIDVVEIDASASYEGPRFSGMIDTTLGYRHYTQDRYDDEPRATLLASADWIISPRQLRWSVSDLLANSPIDPLENTSPANIQFVNALETGPAFTGRLGARQQVDIGLNYARVVAEETAIDHTRHSGFIAWTAGRTSGISYGVTLSGHSTDFDEDAGNIDFDQQSAYLTYSNISETLDLNLAAGVSRVKSVTGFEEDNTTGWLRLDMQRSSNISINLALEREVTDTTAALLEVVRSRERLSPSIVVGEPFLSEYANLRFTQGTGRSYWGLFAGWRRLDFFGFNAPTTLLDPLDQRQRRAGLSGGLQLSSRFSIALSAAASDIEYTSSTRVDDLREGILEFDYRMNRGWSLNLRLMRVELDSTDNTQDFEESQGLLFVEYASRGE